MYENLTEVSLKRALERQQRLHHPGTAGLEYPASIHASPVRSKKPTPHHPSPRQAKAIGTKLLSLSRARLLLHDNPPSHALHDLRIKLHRMIPRETDLLCQVIRQDVQEFFVPRFVKERLVREFGFLV